MALVVDTDVVSFLYKRDTLAELRSWMRHRNWGAARRQRLERYLQRYQVVYTTDALCKRWAEATDSARRNGRPIGAADAWVAATALLQYVPLVTHNRTPYVGVEGLTVISER